MKFTLNGQVLITCDYCTRGTGNSPASPYDVLPLFVQDAAKIPLIKHLRDAHFPGLGLKHAKMIAEEMIDYGRFLPGLGRGI